ncbi:MAG: hypothetical protein AAFX08_02140 [Pseudomonadota bacterium]
MGGATNANAEIDQRLTRVGADGYVCAEDVLFLRQEIYPDGVVDRRELASVFALAERAGDGDQEWRDFFGEICADFFLNEEEPAGYITNGDFAALKALVVRDDAAPSELELCMLVRLMEKAVATPNDMAEFVGEQIKREILAKDAPSVTCREAHLLRRYLYAAGGAGAIAITRDEAELLFDIHDATAASENASEWNELFVKAIAAHLMQYVGYKPLPREEALRLHEWANDHTVNVGGFMSSMFSGGLRAILEAYGLKKRSGRRKDDDEIAIAIAEEVSAREADWLADRIGRNAVVDDAEHALLGYLKELEADLPPKLKALAEGAGLARTA